MSAQRQQQHLCVCAALCMSIGGACMQCACCCCCCCRRGAVCAGAASKGRQARIGVCMRACKGPQHRAFPFQLTGLRHRRCRLQGSDLASCASQASTTSTTPACRPDAAPATAATAATGSSCTVLLLHRAAEGMQQHTHTSCPPLPVSLSPSVAWPACGSA